MYHTLYNSRSLFVTGCFYSNIPFSHWNFMSFLFSFFFSLYKSLFSIYIVWSVSMALLHFLESLSLLLSLYRSFLGFTRLLIPFSCDLRSAILNLSLSSIHFRHLPVSPSLTLYLSLISSLLLHLPPKLSLYISFLITFNPSSSPSQNYIFYNLFNSH